MILSVQGLRAGYGRIPILAGVTFSVAEGDFVGILGHNGMGKTTLLRTLMGYLPATAGTVMFEGRDITAATPTIRARARMGFVPQGREIFGSLSAYENLRMGCLLSRTDERRTIEEVLEMFPRLKRLLERPGGALSGGEQQLLALARCLCGAPKLVLLDEPTEGIQPSIIEEIIDTLQALRKAREVTIILVEQNLKFLSALSQRILIIQKGAITREVSPEAMGNAELIAEFVGMGV